MNRFLTAFGFQRSFHPRSLPHVPPRVTHIYTSEDRNTMRGKWSSFGLELVLLILLRLSSQTPEQDSSDYYVGAVVEFAPTTISGNGPLTLKANTEAYIKYIEEASKEGADIIVFPEDGLTSVMMPDKSRMKPWSTAVPSALDEYVPCTGNREDISDILRMVSCAAKENRIYVVINIAERKSDSNNETHYYNTNAVFDRTGKIIARYRKVNLFNEYPRFDVTETPEIVTFDTDFGVKFGTFICFDILFHVPALNLTRIEGVSNFVYPVAWGSELPFLTALEMQFGWSFSENVNLLAAGYHGTESGHMGSGIYLGRHGIANVSFSHHPDRKLLISRIPKTPGLTRKLNEEMKLKMEMEKEEKTDLLNARRDPPYHGTGRVERIQGMIMSLDSIEAFNTVRLNGSMSSSVCYRDFCCAFDIETASTDSSSNYRAVVYNGLRMHGQQMEAGIRVCGLVQCSNDSVVSCSSVQPSNTVFTSLKIKATFDDYPQLLVIPTLMDFTLFPFKHWTYTTDTHSPHTTVTLALNKPHKDIVSFAIYARDFSIDYWKQLH
ncbi:vanin-like protein 3 isoform X2 [Andrena cerasifolii]|uniref:vanin-like protein 3 isoform X2 n=2 Tax=Andrena cerasifolii TaxID=2819439 RepID=UPI004037FB76